MNPFPGSREKRKTGWSAQYISVDLISDIITKSYETFGITALKPYQLLVMSRIMEQETFKTEVSRDQIVILPTGTGKSLCFLVPALMCRGITVIVYPLLSLMNDQIAKLEQSGIECFNLRGGQSTSIRKEGFSKLREGKCKIVVTNPETLCQKTILGQLSKFGISLFVCDEAHVIAQWGQDFRPSYLKLSEAVDKLKPKQILAFTATASAQTIQIIKKCLFRKNPLVVKGDIDRENIYYLTYKALNRRTALYQILLSCEKPALVFCRTREETYYNCIENLRTIRNIPMKYYNAGLTKPEREKIEKWFMESADGVLFATSAYGMGVDKKNIRSVVHYNLPDSAEEYLQESGRAGRDGKPSKAYVIVTEADMENTLNAVVQIFAKPRCRRSALLLAMGQKKDECTGCDFCDNKIMEQPLFLKPIKKTVKHYPFRYSDTDLCMLLTGTLRNEIDNPFYGKLWKFDAQSVLDDISECKGLSRAGERKTLYPSNKILYNLTSKAVLFGNDIHRFIRKIQKSVQISGRIRLFCTGKNRIGRQSYRSQRRNSSGRINQP